MHDQSKIIIMTKADLARCKKKMKQAEEQGGEGRCLSHVLMPKISLVTLPVQELPKKHREAVPAEQLPTDAVARVPSARKADPCTFLSVQKICPDSW